MKVLVACECSQEVCYAFRAKGHEAYSCDIVPCWGINPSWHLQKDCLEVLEDGWDLMIAHPPCTYLCNCSNVHIHKPGRLELRENGFKFFMQLINAPIPKIAVENPRGYPERAYRAASQIIQPWQFGHQESKATCLWLKNLPPIKPTNIVKPKRVWRNGKSHTFVDLAPKHMRSKTFTGIAKAMADQWG